MTKIMVAIRLPPGSSTDIRIPDGRGNFVYPQPLQGAQNVGVFVLDVLAAFEIEEEKK